jgi:hypothetical protein
MLDKQSNGTNVEELWEYQKYLSIKGGQNSYLINFFGKILNLTSVAAWNSQFST